MAKKNEIGKEYTYDEMSDVPFAIVTKSEEDRRLYQPKGVWELDISLFVETIDPADYFITSGEAIIKARKLEADLFKAAGKARKLVNILNKIKGDNVYLETSWHEGRLILKTKNPRKNPEDKVKALEENFVNGKRYD